MYIDVILLDEIVCIDYFFVYLKNYKSNLWEYDLVRK